MTDLTRSKKGSIWRRWDLHIHAPGTKLASGFGTPDDATMTAYLKELECSDVKVFGITDYFSFDTYISVKAAYQALYPGGRKLFIPNIEFRLLESISKTARNVHTHVLIDPEAAKDGKLQRLLGDLQTQSTENGARLRCADLSSTTDYERATVSIKDLCQALDAVFPKRDDYIIVTAANNDGLRGVDKKSPRSVSISDEIDKASDAFFGSSKNTKYYLQRDRYDGGLRSEPKPVFSGSDAHSFEDLSRLSGDEPGYEPTWIKADLTFHGLRQTLFEPKGRVHIGNQPTVLQRQKQDATRFIAELQVDSVPGYAGGSGSWFSSVVIPFNPELTAIVGNKGSGKSAVADILGLLGESRQSEHFSFLSAKKQNRKFRQKGYAENFVGTLVWGSGVKPERRLDKDIDHGKPEAVKYLPQNYFEGLTNEIEVKAFREEIQEVVFSHVNESDRMGKSSFGELEDLKTAQSKSDISSLKVRLRELNLGIVELEEQASPATRATLIEELNQKREEYRVLQRSMPQEVEKPDGETENQKEVSDEISKVRQFQSELEIREKEAVTKLSSLKADVASLSNIKEAIMRVGSQIKSTKEELRVPCSRLGLEIDKIITYNIDLTQLDSAIEQNSRMIKLLEQDNKVSYADSSTFPTPKSIPDLRQAHQYFAEKLSKLQETLSAPQRRYQRYVETKSDLEGKMTAVMGEDSNPQPGTIKDIEGRIRYIDSDLRDEINRRYASREEIARSIYEAKKKVRDFYESLKLSVEERLETVRSRDFDVTIDASFVPSHEFPKQLFSFVNQATSGPFRGTVEGKEELESRMSETDWDNVDSVFALIVGIIESIRNQNMGKQVSDVKGFYDLLFSFEYFEARYELRLGGKNLNQLSPGEKGLLLLIFYLHLDKEKTPLVIDQPEDNLDNDSIFSVLAQCIRQAKKNRQVILVTHNPNLAVGADAEQILYVSLDKAGGCKFSYESGSIENPRMNHLIVKILEGSKPAFVQRRLKYQIG